MAITTHIREKRHPIVVPNKPALLEGLGYAGRKPYGSDFETCGASSVEASNLVSIISEHPQRFGVVKTSEAGYIAGALLKSIIEADLVPPEISEVVLLCSDNDDAADKTVDALSDIGSHILYCDNAEEMPSISPLIPADWFVCKNLRGDGKQWLYTGDTVTDGIERAMWHEVLMAFYQNIFELTESHFDRSDAADLLVSILSLGKIDCPEHLSHPRSVGAAFSAEWDKVAPDAYRKACLIEDITLLWNAVCWNKGISIACEEPGEEMAELYRHIGYRWGIDYMIDALIRGVALEYVIPDSEFPLNSSYAFQLKRRLERLGYIRV